MANFTNKETYLAARAEWKANYKRITNDIRAARQELKEKAREFNKLEGASYGQAWHALENARDAREALRREARNEIANLFTMKEEAAAQWLEQRAQPA